MRNDGHADDTIPNSETAARTLNALIYREYLAWPFHDHSHTIGQNTIRGLLNLYVRRPAVHTLGAQQDVRC
jgi:hypothetical protein